MTSLQPDTRRPAPHVYHISPDIDDLDFMGHVNNSRYLLWLQEAVLDHWKHVAPPLQRRCGSRFVTRSSI